MRGTHGAKEDGRSRRRQGSCGRSVDAGVPGSREHFYRLLIENALDVIVTLDRDGVIRYGSPSLRRVAGFEPDEVVGKSAFDFIHPEDMAYATASLLGVIEDGGSPRYVELRCRDKSGRWLSVEAIASNLLHEPSVRGVVVNMHDITERKRAEEELQRARDRLEERVNERTRELAESNDALRQSEERFRTIFEKSAVGMALLEIDGTPIEANPALQKLFGYTSEELRALDHVQTENGLADAELFKSMMAGKREWYRVEKQYRRKDGAIVWAHQTLSLLRDSESRPAFIIAMVEDVTERKLAELALRESEEKYRNVVERAHEGICVLQDGVVKYVNPRVREVVGYTTDEIIGASMDRFFHPDEMPKMIERYERRMAGEEVDQIYETSLLHKDGSRVDVEVNAGVITYEGRPADMGMVRDITERKRVEEALRQSEEKLKRYLASSPDAIYINDSKGNFLYGNRAAERVIGYASEELVGRSFLDLQLLPEEYLAKAVDTLRLNMEGKPTGPDEFRLNRKGGSEVYVEITTYPIGEGEDLEVIGIARDITERKRAEEEKHRMEQQLQLAGRLAAVGELAAGVAHEVNNPLTAIQGFAQFLAGRENLDAAMKKDVETIYREAQRATKITGSLLSFARRHKPEKSLMSVNEAVESSIELQAYRLKVNNITVEKELAPDLPNTMADFHQMQQVFVNIINNAEQAMSEAHGRGRLLVKTGLVGDMIRVSIADSGPGVAESDLKGIFDPFFTTKAVGEGTGLGLSICYGIVQEHGGRLYVRNRPGKGATFVVEIPVIAQGEAADEVRSQAGPEA